MRLPGLYLGTGLVSSVCLLGCAYLSGLTDTPVPPPQPAAFSVRRRDKREVDTYYDFLINEWSFKFWAVFQLVTIAILLYSTFAAIYYAKYTYLHTQPSEDDIFFRKRSLDAALRRWGQQRTRYKPGSRNK